MAISLWLYFWKLLKYGLKPMPPPNVKFPEQVIYISPPSHLHSPRFADGGKFWLRIFCFKYVISILVFNSISLRRGQCGVLYTFVNSEPSCLWSTLFVLKPLAHFGEAGGGSSRDFKQSEREKVAEKCNGGERPEICGHSFHSGLVRQISFI